MIIKDRHSGITNPSLVLDELLNFLPPPLFQQLNGNHNPAFSDSKAAKLNSFKFCESLLRSLYEKCYLIKHCYYSKGATVTKNSYFIAYCNLHITVQPPKRSTCPCSDKDLH